jgi:hypothetical protein
MGARYATVQKFGDRKATVGAVVVMCCPRHDDKPGTCLRAGMVVAVSSTKDLPWILDVKHPEHGPTTELRFIPTSNETQMENLPLDAWTWPLP